MPAAAAQQVTARPSLAIALAVIIAFAVTWIGLGIAFYLPYPSGFFITTLAFCCYVVARGFAGSARDTPGAAGQPLARGAAVTFFSELAFLAAVPVAAAAGLTGYFLALRGQVFTADALGHTAYTGAFAALLAGIDLRAGLFAATVSVAVLMGVLGRHGRPDDVVVGSLFAWILGLGAFFQAIYTSGESTGRGNAGVTVLFGSIFGISAAQAWVAAIISIVICLAVLLIARPLLFASVDEATAAAKGVPVRLVGLCFLALVGACAAEAAQVVGALLLLGLLAAPGGAARLLTIRPLPRSGPRRRSRDRGGVRGPRAVPRGAHDSAQLRDHGRGGLGVRRSRRLPCRTAAGPAAPDQASRQDLITRRTASAAAGR